MPASVSNTAKLITEGFGREVSDLPPIAAGRVDPCAWFAHPERPLEIEIGSGKGTFLVQQAPRQPDVNYLGIEQARKYYRYAADRMRRHDLRNVQMLCGDACEFIEYRCPDVVARVIHIYFSDPWPKARHHKRRVVQDRSLKQFHRVLTAEGDIRLVTDHADLWAWYEDHAARHADLFERRDFAAPDSAGGGELIGTNYERKLAREGRPFFAMVLRKCA